MKSYFNSNRLLLPRLIRFIILIKTYPMIPIKRITRRGKTTASTAITMVITVSRKETTGLTLPAVDAVEPVWIALLGTLPARENLPPAMTASVQVSRGLIPVTTYY